MPATYQKRTAENSIYISPISPVLITYLLLHTKIIITSEEHIHSTNTRGIHNKWATVIKNNFKCIMVPFVYTLIYLSIIKLK